MKPRRLFVPLLVLLFGPSLALAQGPSTAVVEFREIELTYSAEAVVEALRQATLAAQVAGRVLDVRADAGDAVTQGQLLVRIDAREAAAGLSGSQAQLANARANYERNQNLFRQKFISQAALDKAEAEYKGASASSGQAGAAYSHTHVTAPFAGLIAQRHVEAGEMAIPGKALMTVYDPKGLRVTASIPQYKLADVRRTLRARIEFPATGTWIDGGTVTVFPAADARTHSVRVRVAVPESVKEAIPGMFARVHFVTGSAKKLLLPARAILRRGEVTAVYVIDAKGAAHLRQVRLSEALAGGYHEVLAGLSVGERVALDPVKAGIPAR